MITNQSLIGNREGTEQAVPSAHDNNIRLNSATGYITPKDMLAGRQQEIHAERDRRLEAARKQRQIRREQAA